MRHTVALLALAWVLLQVTCLQAGDKELPIRITGNQVLIDEVYLAVLDLPSNLRATQNQALRIQKKLLRFLRQAGYVLADVKARVEDGIIRVEVDEGRIEKIVFFGRGALTTLQLRLEVDLPHHVFNKSQLEKRLRRIEKKYNILSVTYRLVPTETPVHEGAQIKDLGEVLGYPIIIPSARYELYIYLGASQEGGGIGAEVEYDFPDGLLLGGKYSQPRLLFDKDRWHVGAYLGGKLRKDLVDRENYVALSRARVVAAWYAPPVVGDWLRLRLDLDSDLTSRQRADINLEIYYSEKLSGALNLTALYSPWLEFSVGGGAQERILFGLHRVGEDPFGSKSIEQFRPFVQFEAQGVANPLELRLDRFHQAQVRLRHFDVGAEGVLELSANWHKAVELGWDVLHLTFNGLWLSGNLVFDDDEPLGGGYVRGVFGDTFFTHLVGAVGIDYRYSLARDLFKVSAYHDLAGFRRFDRAQGEQGWMAANSMGIGFHALLLDVFQLSLYYGVGFATDGSFSSGTSASLQKVF